MTAAARAPSGRPVDATKSTCQHFDPPARAAVAAMGRQSPGSDEDDPGVLGTSKNRLVRMKPWHSRLALCLGVLGLALAAATPRALPAAEPPSSPGDNSARESPPGPRPVEVRLALTIIDFARINNREETFDLHGYLEVSWKDSRLA